jgi:hypothetical protein
VNKIQLWKEVNLELSKISKLNHISLKSKDEKFVFDNILWIDNSFRKLFGLRISNRKIFLMLFENDSSIYKRKIDDSFFENLDFTRFEAAKPIETEPNRSEENPPTKDSYPQVIQILYNFESKGIVEGYLNTIYKTWLSSIEFNCDKITVSCVEILTNWIFYLNSLDDKEFNFNQYGDPIKHLIRKMHQLHLDVLVKKQSYIANYTSFEIWLKLIFNSETKIEFIEGYFSEITFNSFEAIKSNRFDIIKSLIKNITNGIYIGSFDNGFQQLSELVKRKTGFYSTKLNQMEYKLIKRVNNNRDYDSFIKQLDKELVELGLSLSFKEVKIYKLNLAKEFKYLKLQINVYKICIFILFEKKYELLFELINYNQPQDSNAIWSNSDIFPTNLFETLNLLNLESQIEDEFRWGLGDHHGASLYIKQFNYIFLLKNFNAETNKNEYLNFISLFESSSELENIKYLIKGTKNFIQSTNFTADYLNKLIKNEKDNLIDLMNVIEADIDTRLKIKVETDPIKSNYLNQFCNNILDSYNKSCFFKKIPNIGNKRQKGTWLSANKIGIHRFIPRQIFIEWHIPFYGFSENIGSILSDQEDLRILNEIESVAVKEITDEIALAELLCSSNFKNKVIVGVNIYLGDLLFGKKGFTSKFDKSTENELENLLDSFYVGKINDCQIFRIDLPRPIRRVLIFDPSQVSILRTLKAENEIDLTFKDTEHIYFYLNDFANKEYYDDYVKSLNKDFEGNDIFINNLKSNVNFKAEQVVNLEINTGSVIYEYILN